jgi:hypothetical protein
MMASPLMAAIDDRAGRPSVKIEFQNDRWPTSQALPLIGGASADPAGSSNVKILHLAACREGRTSPDLSRSFFAAREAACDHAARCEVAAAIAATFFGLA